MTNGLENKLLAMTYNKTVKPGTGYSRFKDFENQRVCIKQG